MNVRERNCEKKRQDIGHSELFISTIVSIKEKFRFEEEKEKKKKEGKVFRYPPFSRYARRDSNYVKSVSMLNNKVSYG